MKNRRIKMRNQEDNGMKIIQKKLKINNKISQLNNKNYTTQNISFKDPNSSITENIHKERSYSRYAISNQDNTEFFKNNSSQNFYILSNPKIDLMQNQQKIFSEAILNNNNLKRQTYKNRILYFKGANTINGINHNITNKSLEKDYNQIYVHKKLKNSYNFYNNNNIKQTCRNIQKKQIIYGNDFCQTNKSKNTIDSKLIVFTNKPKYFGKKHLSEIESISNGISGKIKDMKYFDSSPDNNKTSYFKPNNRNTKNNSYENEKLNRKRNLTIENNSLDNIDNGYDFLLENLKDYINIYSINNNSISNTKDINDYNEYENNNSSSGKDKKIIRKKTDIFKKNKNIFIETNNINDIKDRIGKKEDNNTININKNININKKVTLMPEEKRKHNGDFSSKTSSKFFNFYKNIINSPYTNYTNNCINKNSKTIDNDNFFHSKTKPYINKFIYQKKNLFSPVPTNKSSSKIIGFNKQNKSYIINNSKEQKNNQISRMEMADKTFYAQKTYSKYYKDTISSKTFNNNFSGRATISNFTSNYNKLKLTKGRLLNNDFYKLNTSNPKQKSFVLNKENIKLNERNEKIEKEDNINTENKITNMSLLEKAKFLEMQLKLVLDKIKKYQNCEKEFYEFIHFYFDHDFYHDRINLFKNQKNKELIKNNTKIEIIYLFICYDILCGKKFNKACIILKSIFCLLYDNFILLLVLIIKNSKNEDREIINNLSLIIEEYKEKNKKLDIININENKVNECILNNSNEIMNYYIMLIDSLYKKFYNEKDYSVKFPDCLKNIEIEKIDNNKIKNVMSAFFYEVYKNIANYDYIEFKYFFYLFLSSKNKKSSIKKKVKKVKLNKNKDKNVKKAPFLPPIKNNYKYTLVLDLDETLIYLQNKDSSNSGKDTIILRPNIHEFLKEMKPEFELIIFSENSKEYVNNIINIIQQKEKFFEHILCKEYITFDNKGKEIKDLKLLGRDLKNVIVVDNMKQFYKNTDNLICIKPFLGDINNDKKTLKILGNVLKEIKLDLKKSGDVGISLNRLKSKLYPMVISNSD